MSAGGGTGPEVTAGERGPLEQPCLAVVAEAFLDRSLPELLDWLAASAPAITGIELGSGGYAPHPHCDRESLLSDQRARARFTAEIQDRGFKVSALNVWGNPLHPDPQIGSEHERALRETIQLAAELEVERVIALAGAPAAIAGDRAPYFAAGGWLPYLEGVYETQWEEAVAPFWSSISEFAAREHPSLKLCLELHPGTAAFNVPTFSRIGALGSNLCATLDPSHFFWQRMDTEAVIGALGQAVGHAHAKDVVFDRQSLATSGLLDHRWPHGDALPWRFATVGDGHDGQWWRGFAGWLDRTAVKAIAIEHEDPEVPAETGVVAAAAILGEALSQATPERRAELATSATREAVA
jgi:sugar phosphate isomerase/epimerase